MESSSPKGWSFAVVNFLRTELNTASLNSRNSNSDKEKTEANGKFEKKTFEK